MRDPRKLIGKSCAGVTLELILDEEVTRPRVAPVDTFPRSIRVEFPRGLGSCRSEPNLSQQWKSARSTLMESRRVLRICERLRSRS